MRSWTWEGFGVEFQRRDWNHVTTVYSWIKFSKNKIKNLIRKGGLQIVSFAKHMKLKKKEEQSVDTLVLLKMGNKTPKEGVTETKFRAETEERIIQRLPPSTPTPIQLINNHQTQTLLLMPARFCWHDHDIAISCEAMPVPGKYRSRCS